MDEREAAIAPLYSHGTGVEFEVFDERNDVVVVHRHCAILMDRRATVFVKACGDPQESPHF